jgi:hypothetical protein
MVSTHNKMNEVDMEPIYGYYEKYSLVSMGGGAHWINLVRANSIC